MSFLLFFVPSLVVAITAVMFLVDYFDSFNNDQFTTMDLPRALATPAARLKLMAKAAGR